MKTFPKGIHPNGYKDLSKDVAIEVMPSPSKAYLSLSQHLGKPAVPVVAVGDEVSCGQLIARADGVISSNIFSSICGKVVGIEDRQAVGGKIKHIVIEKTGVNTVTMPRLSNPSSVQIVERLKECGVVGLGGAGFPTNVKLSVPKASPVDTLIINGAECEPYITCDYRVMIEYTKDFLEGVNLLARAVNVKKAFIGIESNKMDACEILNAYLVQHNITNIEIVPLVVKYPQGAEKQLIYSVTGRTVPCGQLPSSVGCVVCNVHTAYSAYLAVELGQPLYSRALTVTGQGITTPKNLWVSNGTLYSDIIAFCGGEKPSTVKLISGGPMMGIAVAGGDIATTKTTSCLLLLTADEANLAEPSACINCAKCAFVCPMKLMPMYIDACVLSSDLDGAQKYGANNCMECGCCAYICPAKRPLVQSIKLAKKKLRQRGEK